MKRIANEPTLLTFLLIVEAIMGRSDLTPEDRLSTLGASSLDYIELTIQLEYLFNRVVVDALDFIEVDTIGEIWEIAESRIDGARG